MYFNKEKFLKTELGCKLDCCIRSLDNALNSCRFSLEIEEYKIARKVSDLCQAQWEVYKIVIKQFYGVEYCFTRTDEYFGLVTEDETDWLIKIER